MARAISTATPAEPARFPIARVSRSPSAPRRLPRIVASAIELWTFGEVLQELVKRDLKVRYKRSVLGLFWTMLNPLLMMLITSIVFSALFRSSITDFPVYVLSGYIVWAFFSQASVAASSSILDSAGLTRKIYVPPALFPLACNVSALVNLALALVPLTLLVLLTGHGITWAWLVLPFSFLLLAMFTHGLGLILAASSVFFRDTVYTFQVLLVAWMYLTPLFYPASIIPPRWSPFIEINPIYHYVQLVRAPVYTGSLPSRLDVLIAAGFAILLLAVGTWYFEHARVRFVSYL